MLKQIIQNCTKRAGKPCLIWSFIAKMDNWQDATWLSWFQLMVEIKQHKLIMSQLKDDKTCNVVHKVQLRACEEQLCVLKCEGKHRKVVAAE